MMKMTKKIAAMVMTGALVAAMSVPAFAGVASYDIGSLNAKNAYSFAAAEYANAIHEAAVAQAAVAQAAVDPAAPVVVAAADGTQVVYANYSEYAAAMANAAREAFAAQGIDNAAALGYGVN